MENDIIFCNDILHLLEIFQYLQLKAGLLYNRKKHSTVFVTQTVNMKETTLQKMELHSMDRPQSC